MRSFFTVFVFLLVMFVNSNADTVDDYDLDMSLVESLQFVLEAPHLREEDKRSMGWMYHMSTLSGLYTNIKEGLIPEKNGKCGNPTVSEEEFKDNVKNYKTKMPSNAVINEKSRDSLLKYMIGTMKIQRKFCEDPEGFENFFEKEILNEYNSKNNTNFTMDRINGNFEWLLAGIKREDISKWKAKGFNDYGAKHWAKHVSTDVEEVIAWKELGYFNVMDVAFMKKEGYVTAKEASVWKSIDEYKECKQYGYADSKMVSKWRKQNVPCREINDMVSSGTGNAKGFSNWKSIGITDPSTIRMWSNAGYYSPSDLGTWIEQGVSEPSEIDGWRAIGVVVPSDISKWKSIGIRRPGAARGWFQNTSVKNIDDVMEWVNAGISNTSDIVLWRTEVGAVDIATILSWKSMGAKNPYAAAKMRRNGIVPSKVSPRINSRSKESKINLKSVPEKRRSEGRTITAKGIIVFATLDSAIEINDGEDSIGFLTNSEIGNKIFSICKVGEYCEITGVVNNEFFLSVSNVKSPNSVKKADTTTHGEQSNSRDNHRVFEYHTLVNTKNLNVRSGNGRDFKVVGVLNPDDMITVGGCIEAHYGGDVWCEVKPSRPYDRFVGWVNSDFIEGIETRKSLYKIINIPMNDSLTLRQGNSSKTKKVADLTRTFNGFQIQMCAINAQNQEWCKMNHYDLKGWVMKKYVTPNL